MPDKRLRILFVCTHNSARSQMAEGWLRHLAGDRFEVHSAGTEATAVRPLAIRAMAEVGVDISEQWSKGLGQFLGQSFDVVVTVCDEASETCPVFPGGGRRLHWSLPDPSQVTGPDDQGLGAFREVRDRLRHLIERFVASSGEGRGDAR